MLIATDRWHTKYLTFGNFVFREVNKTFLKALRILGLFNHPLPSILKTPGRWHKMSAFDNCFVHNMAKMTILSCGLESA